MTSSMGCMDLAAMTRSVAEPTSEGEGLATSTACWNLTAMAKEEPTSEGKGLTTSTACWNLAAMAKEGVRDEWAMDVDEE